MLRCLAERERVTVQVVVKDLAQTRGEKKAIEQIVIRAPTAWLFAA